MSLHPETVASAALIVTIAYTVFGLTGFGSTITAMPWLAHILPLRFAVPMMLLLDVCAGLLVGLKNRGAVDRKELVRLVPFMLIGIALGVTVLVEAPERWLILTLGCVVSGYATWSLFAPHDTSPIAAGWSAPLGIVGGIFSALFGTGGPAYAIYLARRLRDKAALRATTSSIISLSGLSRLAVFTAAGLYAQRDILLLAAMLLPCALLGLVIGSRLHRRFPAQYVVKTVWAILIFGGISLIARGCAAA